MTDEELDIVNKLGDVWKSYLSLPNAYGFQEDRREFMQAIHACQNIVMSRMASRWIESNRIKGVDDAN